jgi:hypothetical protein
VFVAFVTEISHFDILIFTSCEISACFVLHIIYVLTITICFLLQQPQGSAPVPAPPQTVKTFSPANPMGLKNAEQYHQPNTLGSQLYTVDIMLT